MKLYRNFTSQEEIDNQYNGQILVPEMFDILRAFSAASARARQELDSRLDIPYGPTLDETFDIFPASEPGAPVVVFIHGGYWRWGSSKDFSAVARGLVSHGYSVVVTNYSLCPKVALPEITRQQRAVVAHLASNAGDFKIDADRIFVSGHSAGGQQVGMLMSTDWVGEYGLPPGVIKGGVAISGLFDLQPFRYSWLQPKLLLNHETIMQESPIMNLPDQRAPLLLSVGELESAEFHRQSEAYLEAWQNKGFEGRLYVQPGLNHYLAINGLADPGSEFCREVVRFLGSVQAEL